MRTAQNGLNPERTTVKTIKIEAIEFLDAKKPLVVEIRPVMASANEARPIIGDKKTDSMLPLHEKNGRKASLIFEKKWPREKSSIRNRALAVSGKRRISYPSTPTAASMMTLAIMNGTFGKDLIMKRRCGCKKAYSTTKMAK